MIKKKKGQNWFTRASLLSAMNDPYSGAVMQASGFLSDSKDGVMQGDPNEEGARRLAGSLSEIASIPMFDLGLGMAGEAAMSIPKIRRAVTAIKAAKELNRGIRGASGVITESASRSGAPLLYDTLGSGEMTWPEYLSTYRELTAAPRYSGSVAVRESPKAGNFVEDVSEAIDWAMKRGETKPSQSTLLQIYPKDYIGHGSESIVYGDRNNPNMVLKVIKNSIEKNIPGAEMGFSSPEEAVEYAEKALKKKNSRPYNLRENIVGVIENEYGNYSPVSSQMRVVDGQKYIDANPEAPIDFFQRFGRRIGDNGSWAGRYVNVRPNEIIYENSFIEPRYNPFGEMDGFLSKDFKPENIGILEDGTQMGIDLRKYGGLISRLQKHYGSNDKVLSVVRKMKNGGPEGEGDVDFVGPPVPYSLVTAGDIPMPEYDIFNDASSYNRRDAHLKSLDAFIKANPTVSGLNTADFRDVLSQFAGLESSYKEDASNKSGYSGYYGLKGGSALAEDAQHRRAYEHLANLFKHSITRNDIQKGIDMGYTPAQILYKYWNQGNNATEFLQNGSAATIGNNPGLDIMGNNISAIADYYKYIPEAIMDDFHVVKSGDNFSTIQERVRKPGRHYNQAGKDLKQWNTDDIVNGKLRIGDKVWFTTPYEDGGNLFWPGGTVERRNYNGVPTTLESYKQQQRDFIIDSAVQKALERDEGVAPIINGKLDESCLYTVTDNFGKKYRVAGNQAFMANPGKYGFAVNGPIENAGIGTLYQFIDPQEGLGKVVPHHMVLITGYDDSGNPLVSYSHGNAGVSPKEKDYKRNAPLWDSYGYETYRFVGTPDDNALWEQEYAALPAYDLIPPVHNNLENLRDSYRLSYAEGGKIHIKPENRGKFTALLKRTGKSASWFKAHGTPLQRKRATFALNARKWKHADGGLIDRLNVHTGGDAVKMLELIQKARRG